MGEGRRRRLVSRYAEDARFDRGTEPVVLSSRAGVVREREHAPVNEATFPARHEPIRHPERRTHGAVAVSVGEEQHAPRATHDTGRGRRGANDALEIGAFGGSERELHRRGKHAHAHCKRDAIRILLSIH